MKLVICGPINKEDPYHSYILSLADGNPNIVFMNNVDGILKNTMYKYAYICCLTSESEGMSTSLLEMMSYGKCVIASRLQENIDVLEDAGIYFDSCDEISLQRCLEYSEANPDEVCLKGAKSYAIWESNYTVKTVADKYEAFYRRVLNEKTVAI